MAFLILGLFLPLFASCGRKPEKPRLVFYAGSEIWGTMAAVDLDSILLLPARSWGTNFAHFVDEGEHVRLDMRLLRVPTNQDHRWRLVSTVEASSPQKRGSPKAFSPIYAREKWGGFLEFSTGEAVRVRCNSRGRVRKLGKLVPGQTYVVSCDTLVLVQPISQVALVMTVAADSGWTNEWRLRRQRRRKRRYDLVLWQRPTAPLRLETGQPVQLPQVEFLLVTGAKVRRLYPWASPH